MSNKQPGVSSYRWVILAAFMLISLVIQIQWLTHAPIARAAAVYYKGQFNPESFVNIDMLAMMYMLVYLVMCIPASYFIDTWGIRLGVGLGAVLAAIGATIKGFYGYSFTAVLVGQLFLSIAQPFILNAITAVTVRWFPIKERALAAGLASLAQYLGIVIAMVVTPLMIVSSPSNPAYGSGIDHMLKVYGILTVVSSVLVILVFREHPSVQPSDEPYERFDFIKGFRHILGLRDMLITILLFTVGLGIFNAVSSMVDAITANLGVQDSNGMIGGLMLVGGIVGAIVIPALSDYTRRRKIFLVICLAGMLPGIAGLTFAAKLTGGVGVHPLAAYHLALTSGFILGFFVMSAGPIGFQYAAEVSAPAPESTSQGLLLLSGQISGIILVMGMSMKNNHYLPLLMIVFVVLTIIALASVFFLKESSVMLAERLKGRR